MSLSLVDVIVIGAGHNGLTCAAYLAKARLRVVVFEKETKVGGGCKTEEVTLPGFKHNTCSVVHTSIPLSPIYNDLELGRYGLKYIFPDFPRVGIFKNGKTLLMYRDLDKFCEEIAKFSHKDAITYRKIVEEYRDFVELVHIPWMYSSPIPPSVQAAELEKSEEGRMFLQLQASSPYHVLNEFFESDEVKNHFLTRVTVLGFSPDDYGLGHIALFRAIKAEAPVCVGGSEKLAEALKNVVLDNGGQVITSLAVEKILIKNGEAYGVKLANGKEIHAKKAVVSSLNPKITFLKMIDGSELPERFIRRVKNYHSNSRSLFAIHLALNESPKYVAAKHSADVNRGFSQEMFGDSMDQQVRVYSKIKMGLLPDEEALQVPVPTLYDPSQAPPGKHVAVVWQYAPYRLAVGGEERWNEVREEYADFVLSLWQSYTTNINKNNILGLYIQDPLRTYQKHENYENGVDVVGDLTPDQLGYFRPIPGYNYRTPIKRLYLCGGSSHPSGGVTAAPGYNAAGVILDDLNIERWWR